MNEITDVAVYDSDAWKSMIKSMSQVPENGNVVIYCGAGVTIDRTGVGWSELLAKAFSIDSTNNWYPDDVSIKVLQDILSPDAFAELMEINWRDNYSSMTNPMNPLYKRMSELLYAPNGWDSGRLCTDVARLAIWLARASKQSVHLITTNYETYLEASLVYERKKLQLTEGGAIIPNQKLTISDSEVELRVTANCKKAVQKPGRVTLRYLHGCIKEDGSPSGNIILSESDYEKAFSDETKLLKESFKCADRLVVIGASLTDLPLLHALIQTSSHDSSDVQPSENRFAIVFNGYVDKCSDDGSVAKSVRSQLRKRGQTLDLNTLTPDFKFQVPQILEETVFAIDLYKNSGATYGGTTSYANQLRDWWKDWFSKNPISRDPKDIESLCTISEVLSQDLKDLSETMGFAYDETVLERMRLEIWVRREAPDAHELALWCTSAGPVLDEKVLNRKPLYAQSTNSAVRAFIEGRPVQHDLTDLIPDMPSNVGRWKSFLSIPIHSRTKSQQNAIKSVPVGVITLASNLPLMESQLSPEKTRLIDMERVVKFLRGRGEALLSPQP